MKMLLSLFLSLALALPALAVERVHGKVLSEFNFSDKARVSKKKARFMVKAMLDKKKISGMEGLVSLELSDEAMDMKFRVYRSKDKPEHLAYFRLANWGIAEEFAHKASTLEVARRIEMAKIQSVQLFKAKSSVRVKAGKVRINDAGTAKDYYCRLDVADEAPFDILATSKKQAFRLAVAFSALTGLDIQKPSEINPSGLRLDGENMIIEKANGGSVQGLDLFAVIKALDGSKVIADDNVVGIISEMSEGSHTATVTSPKGKKKKKVSFDVLP